ncbi:MAG: Nif3-like dinuclear metal center hexameric protein [Candidatus Thorarchaeota archaeon]|jgi:putative NIF3 family GTP cyclohydrolase 1 type 2/rhodanese-related sulfurtransferase
MINRISIDDFENLKVQEKDIKILDVRPIINFQTGHIDGAISMPLHTICDRSSELQKKQKIVVYSQNAKDSMSTQAVLALKEQGFSEVSMLECGIEEWNVLEKPIGNVQNLLTSDVATPYKAMSIPLFPKDVENLMIRKSGEFIDSDEIVKFIENRTQIYDFDHLGYEVKCVEQVSGIYLMINPDPKNFEHVPENSIVICHHKISTHHNRIYREMLEQAREQKFNIYNIHLGWDVMPDGIGDSFLHHFGLTKDEFQKVDLTYREHKISKLGAIINRPFTIDELVQKLSSMNVFPSVIINPLCTTTKVGYIPGGGFVDQMIIEMADMGVDVLISSDVNWVVETVARECGVTLIEINHYVSERYGLHSMKRLLSSKFPGTPVHILENIDNIQCDAEKCTCCEL